MANADFNSIILNEASIDDSTGTPVPNIGTFIGESGGTVSMAVSQTTFLRGTPPLNIVSYQKPYGDRKSTRLNSSHLGTSYAVFCLKKPKPSVPWNHSACMSSRSSVFSAPRYTGTSYFFNDTATTEIYTLSLHDALPI